MSLSHSRFFVRKPLSFCAPFVSFFFIACETKKRKRKNCGQKNDSERKKLNKPSPLALPFYLRPIPPAFPFIFFFSPPPPAPPTAAPRFIPAAPPPLPSFLTSPLGATGLKNESSLPCCALAPAAPRRLSAPRMRPSSKSFSRTRNWMIPSTSGLVNLIGGSWSSGATLGSVCFFCRVFWGSFFLFFRKVSQRNLEPRPRPPPAHPHTHSPPPKKKNQQFFFSLPLNSFLACSNGNGSGTGYLARSMFSRTFSIVPCARIRFSADLGPTPRIDPA